MESWLKFDDKLRSGSTFRSMRSSRLSSTSVTASSLSTSCGGMSHLSFLEESRRLDLQAASIRESGRLAGTRRDLEFTSRKLELAHKFKTLMRTTGERHYDENLNSSETSNFPHGEFDELKKNFRAVQEENFKLQAVITDVTEVNKRWQKYNNDRQMYVQRLLSTIQDQQEQMNKIAEERIFQSKELCDQPGETKSTVEALTFENVRLQEEVMLLRQRLDSIEKEHREHVEVLEFQLKAHRDDWEAERSEKQQAQQDKETADKKLRELLKDLRTLKQKYREEKLQNSSHCRCCGGNAGQCNIFLPGSQMHMGQKIPSKTYRTSGNLLPRGTTIFFGDDLTVDGDDTIEPKITELSEDFAELKGNTDSSIDCVGKLCENVVETKLTDTEKKTTFKNQSAIEFDGNNNTSVSVSDNKLVKHEDSLDSFEIVGLRSSEHSFSQLESRSSSVGLNLEHEECSPSSSSTRVSCSVVHITPSGSGSSIEPDAGVGELGVSEESMAASGVTIGFNSSGLASVMAFSHTPVAKSSSLPTPEGNRRKTSLADDRVNPLVTRWSFDSQVSNFPIASPPITQNFAASADSLTKKMLNDASVAVIPGSEGAACLASSVPVPRKSPSWKMSYYDEGAPTQTEDDVICPGCGQIFPPKLHIKFLDHFEKCQSNERDHKRSKSRN
ncbi:uncharacterized protein [Anabrus simplex]|uniref:uncharacterized protein isoform X2 n=1 Tax=Anabrus simplex TaxID=316456 RepID=UPI0035A2FEFC